MGEPELDRRVRQYAEFHRREFELKQALGEGTDGRVWFTTSNSAIKVFHRPENYCTELGCYQRLMQKGVKEIDGLSVPQLIDHSPELAIIEITLVQPPYLLDFGKGHGIDYVDPKPWNIRFRKEEDDEEQDEV